MNLAKALQALVYATVNYCKAHKENENIAKITDSYIQFDIRKERINSTVISYLYDSYLLKKEIVDIDKVSNYVVTNLIKDFSFKNSLSILQKKYNYNLSKAKKTLIEFIETVIMNYFITGLPHEDIEELIDVFIGDLEDKPIFWEIRVLLSGINMYIDKIELEDGIILREIKPSDLEFSLEHLSSAMKILRYNPSAVLEINKKMKFQPFICSELEETITSMQLYTVGFIEQLLSKWHPHTILKTYWNDTSFSFPGQVKNYTTIYISSRDKETLPKFIKKIKPILLSITNKEQLQKKFCKVAISYYKNALYGEGGSIFNEKMRELISTKEDVNEEDIQRLQKKVEQISLPEKMIINSLLGLKALYLSKEENLNELKNRVSVLLSYFGEKSEEVSKNIKKAYNIYNIALKDNSTREKSAVYAWEILELLNKTIEYLRKSIVIFLQVNLEKEKFLQLIDETVKNDEATTELESVLKSCVTVIGKPNEILLV